jgi:hypothetical protein
MDHRVIFAPSAPTPSTSSAVKTPDPQYSGPSPSLVEIEETPKEIERGSDAHEPSAEGDIQMDAPLISCAAQV